VRNDIQGGTMTRKLTTFALFTALMVVGGYILYLISNFIAIPGSKFIIMGPFLTLIMTIPLIRYPRFGTLSLINLAFGGLMLIFSPWMMLAIVVSGVLADCVILIPIWRKARILLAMGVYNGVSLLTSVYVTIYVTGNSLYKILNVEVLLGALLIAVITGSLGGFAGLWVDKVYLKSNKEIKVVSYRQ
jgi:hypothetical protein